MSPETLTARTADPITSKLSAFKAEKNRSRNEERVLEILATTPGLTSYELSEVLEIAYVTISPLMRPMARRGLVHEVGMRDNPGSGHQAVVWAVGPSADWKPDHSLPAVPTGPQRPRFRPWTEEEIMEIRESTGGYLDLFVSLLNAKSEERLY